MKPIFGKLPSGSFFIMNIAVSITRPQSAVGAETTVGLERQKIFSQIFETDGQRITLREKELGCPDIRELIIVPYGHVLVKPRSLPDFKDQNKWLHQTIPVAKNRWTPMNGFTNGRDGDLDFRIIGIKTDNLGAVIFGPNDYQIRIEWQ